MKHEKIARGRRKNNTPSGIARREVIKKLRENVIDYKAADIHSCYPYELCKVNKNSIYGTVNEEV